MVTTRHLVDHQSNILHLGNEKKGWSDSVIGLPPDCHRLKGLQCDKPLAVTTIAPSYDQAIWEATTGITLSKELKDLVTQFREVFKRPEGLPPDHQPPGFRIRLQASSEPSHRPPYCLTVK